MEYNNDENPENREKNFPCSLIRVDRIPQKLQPVFSNYIYFNRIQSSVFPDIFLSDEPIIVSAPTGSGKTLIFELAITRLLNNLKDSNELSDVKIIYVSPMKALCEERYLDWHKKFSCLNLNCILVTGDNDIPISNLLNQNLIITTPEKWDSLTRRWKKTINFVENIRLFLIDEVHLLGEDRGPTLEAIVCRMKTMEDHISTGSRIRFVAVSATIPNVQDIAEWLGRKSTPAKFFCFDEEARPVKLTKIVHGYYYNPNSSTPFKFDLMLNYKLQSLILNHSNGKPTLIFCSTRKSVELTVKHLINNLTINLNPEQKNILREAMSKMEAGAAPGLIYGFGCHHGGMLLETRKLIEELFRNGNLPVLVTTSTLAMGVNLPAHLVIIKSTKFYYNGEYKDYTETTLLQMIGRAGRPQFDHSATAIILTTNADKKKYEDMTNSEQPIESRLHKNLTEHLNSEIVLRTITNLPGAIEWVSTTYLFVRAKKNPRHYGIPLGLSPDQLDRKMLDMCQIDINKLAKAGMITMDQHVGLDPTVMGTLMAKYHLRLETMKLFKELTGNEILQQMLSLVSRCDEFSDLFLRVNDKKALNLLNKCKGRETIRFPLSGKIKTLDMKINCIIQAVFGCLQILEPSLQIEAQKIIRIGERVTQCLAEFMETKTKCYLAFHSILILSQCFHSKLWENSQYVSRQLTGIGPVISKNLVNSGKTSFKSIMEVNPRNLEVIIHRKSPMGDNIKKEVEHLPQYDLKMFICSMQSPIAKVKIILKLINFENLKTERTTKNDSFMTLLVGDSDNNILCYRKYTHVEMVQNPEVVITLDQECSEKLTLRAHFISSSWAGLDCYEKLEIFPNPPSKTNQNSNQTPKKYIDDYFRTVKNPLKFNFKQARMAQNHLHSSIENREINATLKPIDETPESIDREALLLMESDSDDKIFEQIDEAALLNSDNEEDATHDCKQPIVENKANLEKVRKEIIYFSEEDDSNNYSLSQEFAHDFITTKNTQSKCTTVDYSSIRSVVSNEFINEFLGGVEFEDININNQKKFVKEENICDKDIIYDMPSNKNDYQYKEQDEKDFKKVYEEFMNYDVLIDGGLDEKVMMSTPKSMASKFDHKLQYLTETDNETISSQNDCEINDKEIYIINPAKKDFDNHDKRQHSNNNDDYLNYTHTQVQSSINDTKNILCEPNNNKSNKNQAHFINFVDKLIMEENLLDHEDEEINNSPKTSFENISNFNIISPKNMKNIEQNRTSLNDHPRPLNKANSNFKILSNIRIREKVDNMNRGSNNFLYEELQETVVNPKNIKIQSNRTPGHKINNKENQSSSHYEEPRSPNSKNLLNRFKPVMIRKSNEEYQPEDKSDEVLQPILSNHPKHYCKQMKNTHVINYEKADKQLNNSSKKNSLSCKAAHQSGLINCSLNESFNSEFENNGINKNSGKFYSSDKFQQSTQNGSRNKVPLHPFTFKRTPTESVINLNCQESKITTPLDPNYNSLKQHPSIMFAEDYNEQIINNNISPRQRFISNQNPTIHLENQTQPFNEYAHNLPRNSQQIMGVEQNINQLPSCSYSQESRRSKRRHQSDYDYRFNEEEFQNKNPSITLTNTDLKTINRFNNNMYTRNIDTMNTNGMYNTIQYSQDLQGNNMDYGNSFVGPNPRIYNHRMDPHHSIPIKEARQINQSFYRTNYGTINSQNNTPYLQQNYSELNYNNLSGVGVQDCSHVLNKRNTIEDVEDIQYQSHGYYRQQQVPPVFSNNILQNKPIINNNRPSYNSINFDYDPSEETSFDFNLNSPLFEANQNPFFNNNPSSTQIYQKSYCTQNRELEENKSFEEALNNTDFDVTSYNNTTRNKGAALFINDDDSYYKKKYFGKMLKKYKFEEKMLPKEEATKVNSSISKRNIKWSQPLETISQSMFSPKAPKSKARSECTFKISGNVNLRLNNKKGSQRTSNNRTKTAFNNFPLKGKPARTFSVIDEENDSLDANLERNSKILKEVEMKENVPFIKKSINEPLREKERDHSYKQQLGENDDYQPNVCVDTPNFIYNQPGSSEDSDNEELYGA